MPWIRVMSVGWASLRVLYDTLGAFSMSMASQRLLLYHFRSKKKSSKVLTNREVDPEVEKN